MRRAVVPVFVIVFALGPHGCSSPSPAPASVAARAERWTGSLAPPPATGAEVVAVVNGDPIYAADLELQMRATGQERDRAVDELIGAMLFAQEAYRRGLADHPDVREARERESVRLVLTRVFEPSFARPADIPEDEVEMVYRQPDVHQHYEHETIHTVFFLRVELPPKATPEQEDEARPRAEQAYALLQAHPPADKDAFLALAKEHPELRLKPELRPFATGLHGPGQATFAKAALAITRLGAFSPPTRTPWGFDIIYLQEILPELHTPKAEAEADIREHWFEPARKRGFDRFIEGLTARHQIVKDEAALEKVVVDSLVGSQ